MAIKKGVRRNGIGLLARIEQGRATGSARGKDGEARELLRICRVHVWNERSSFRSKSKTKEKIVSVFTKKYYPIR